MDTKSKLSRNSRRGDTFFSALIFLFVLIGTLRLCCEKTLHESKLSAIFIEETQAYYLLENLMAFTRDYVYQALQDPKTPHVFLGLKAFREKETTYATENNKKILDFKGSLSQEQIVPSDFPLQIDWTKTLIEGGPIFWQDKNKNDNDERYLSEIYMLGTLHINSKFVPNWDTHMVQTIEIERNPLCDFQLYSEGDISMGGNITTKNSNWYINFSRPIQINGNSQFPRYQGWNNGETNKINFNNKFNIAGFGLKIKEKNSSASYIKIPSKYCIYDNSSFYNNFTNPYTTGENSYKTGNINLYSYLSNTSGSSKIYKDYQLFDKSNGQVMTRSRILRPSGFDPISDWGYWVPGSTTGTGGKDENNRMLEFCFGFHNLCKTSAVRSSNMFSTSRPKNAMKNLRGLNEYQMLEKAWLVETQKPINYPCLGITILLKTSSNVKNLTHVDNLLYPTYKSDYFPCTKDNIFLTRYLSLKSKNLSIIDLIYFYIDKEFSISNEESAALPSSNSIRNLNTAQFFQKIWNNKLVISGISTINIDPLSSVKEKSEFKPNGYNDDSCPPHKLVDKGNHWELDDYITRVKMGETYQFMYDKNRSKWIQIVDIDINKLSSEINWNEANHILKINTFWIGHGNNANRNYKNYASDNNNDIRLDYINNRKRFFDTYTQEGSYNYGKDPVIDIGVRLINAGTLPLGGLTIVCPFPLYIKGNFNTNSPKPALIVTDSLTVLSNEWKDWKSVFDYKDSYLFSNNGKTTISGRNPPEIYANIITGRAHPKYWLNDIGLNPDNGFHDAIRTLEDMSSPLKLHGSLMLPYYCQQQWEPPINFCHKSRSPTGYGPVNLFLENDTIKPTPGMPFYNKVNRGRKTQVIGHIAYSILQNIARDIKVSNSFSTYHNYLPNYLKYEEAPK